jgi:hypothetical protein
MPELAGVGLAGVVAGGALVAGMVVIAGVGDCEVAVTGAVDCDDVPGELSIGVGDAGEDDAVIDGDDDAAVEGAVVEGAGHVGEGEYDDEADAVGTGEDGVSEYDGVGELCGAVERGIVYADGDEEATVYTVADADVVADTVGMTEGAGAAIRTLAGV